jgi:hypothetical protein
LCVGKHTSYSMELDLCFFLSPTSYGYSIYTAAEGRCTGVFLPLHRLSVGRYNGHHHRSISFNFHYAINMQCFISTLFP